jgi:tetratricopeptide (TPR) repeat protein
LAQAAAYLDETGIPVSTFLERLNEREYEILDQASTTSYPRSLAAVTQMSFDRLASEDPAATELASACAFLAPEPIPVAWCSAAARTWGGPLAEATKDPVTWRQSLTRLDRTVLATTDRDKLLMHPLTQAVIRGHLDPSASVAARARAIALLVAGAPTDEGDPATWPQWAELMPHLLALDPGSNADRGLGSLALRAVRYLLIRGEVIAAHDLARELYVNWKRQLGPDDSATLMAGSYLASAVRIMGRYDEARELDAEALAGWRQSLGEDHPITLSAASSLIADLFGLGDYQAARELNQDTFDRRRRVLGEDHPDTLGTASNLAASLRALGEYRAARDLDEDTLARRRRVLGEDHPDTVASASAVDSDLRRLGREEGLVIVLG